VEVTGQTLGVILVLVAGVNQDVDVLRSSHNREAVAAAAVRTAKSGNAAALGRLADWLATDEFLKRLDDTDVPQLATVHVRQVFAALAEHPSPAAERLCLRVADAPAFMADEARTLVMLRVLAAVRPMSTPTEALFRKLNAEGYAASNAVLLADNGSPRALGALEAMLADAGASVDDRIDIARHAIVPHRIERSVVELVQRLVERPVEPGLIVALAESIFDYRPDEWYGKRRNPPKAPDWKTAKPEAARAAVALAGRLLARSDLPERLHTVMQTFAEHRGRAKASP
jgi:hypothetical protein